MTRSSSKIELYLETGTRRSFVASIDWPGWCRSGRDEHTALASLMQAAPRYAKAIQSARLGFRPPADPSAFVITERHKGSATTDFGAPDRPLKRDLGPVDRAELRRLQTILRACWRAFDAAAAGAEGRTLRRGPRGGGRSLEAIRRHVLDAEIAYLARLGGKFHPRDGDLGQESHRLRHAILEALSAAAPIGTPASGPRGGARWHPRFFARRLAWHTLDHAWEIEDRLT